MKYENIIEIGINKDDQLYVKPEVSTFPMIYREAVEVSWDADLKILFSPKPREWSYYKWIAHIIETSTTCDTTLVISQNTLWTNVPVVLKDQILSYYK